jgi:hypothetical protein
MAVAQVRTNFGSAAGADRTLAQQVRAEYAAMPGLSLTLQQAQRLWAVDRPTCQALFSRLVERGVLRLTAAGRFVLAERGRALATRLASAPQKPVRPGGGTR